MRRLLVTLVLAYVVHSTWALQCLTPEDEDASSMSNPTSRRELLRSQLDFSLKLLKAVGKQEPSDNIFISPLSIYNALLQAYFVSAGHTETSLRDTLVLPKNVDKANMLFAYRLQKKLTYTEVYLSQVHTDSKLFLSMEQTVKDCVKFYFDHEIEKLDFSGNGLLHSVDVINNWVSNITQNNINNLISAQDLNPSTQLILVNAAYFKGLWKDEFRPEYTRNGTFYITKDKSVPALMMYQQGTFRHWRSNDLNTEVLEMPYKNGDISMIIFLPDETNSAETPATEALLQRLERNTLLNIIKELKNPNNEDKFEVKIPKYTVERTIQLTPILEGLGVGDLFKPTSNLTGLTGGPQIQLNTAVHKAKIRVDEKGTEAAAATAFLDTRIPGEGFLCDRPFLYMLYDKSQETLLFAGIYNDPTK